MILSLFGFLSENAVEGLWWVDDGVQVRDLCDWDNGFTAGLTGIVWPRCGWIGILAALSFPN